MTRIKSYIRANSMQLMLLAIFVLCFGVFGAHGVHDPYAAGTSLALGASSPHSMETLLSGMMLAGVVAPFPTSPELTAIAIAYRNVRLIADDVFPRVPVGLQSFRYLKYDKGEIFTPPETRVGRTGQPNRVEFTATGTDGSTDDHALDDAVPNSDIALAAATPGLPDPLGRSVEGITDLLGLRREKRCADLAFDTGQYAAANQAALAGTDQWDAFATSDPISDIMDALDSMVMRGNIAVMGNSVSSKLRRHPNIVKAYNGTAGDKGIVPMEFIKDLFELENVLVGQGWINTAKKGQPANLVRVWGNHMSLMFRDTNADTQRGTTFGYTAQWGGKVAGNEYDKNIGMRGGQIVRVGESVKELITANDLGYLIENAVSG